jgi:hypothetical protein
MSPPERAEGTSLPPDIDDAETARAFCAGLAASAARLSGLIERESALIETGALSEIDGLRAEKAELAAAYLADMARLKRNAGVIKELAPDAAADLQPTLTGLGARLLANQNAMAAVLSVTERLIRTAALKAVATEQGPNAYGADAKLSGPRGNTCAGTTSRRA